MRIWEHFFSFILIIFFLGAGGGGSQQSPIPTDPGKLTPNTYFCHMYVYHLQIEIGRGRYPYTSGSWSK